MKLLINLILVAGFCLGTVGAAGFHVPMDAEFLEAHPDAGTEPLAWPLFGVGLGLVFVGGYLSRLERKALVSGDGENGGLKGQAAALLETIRDHVVELDEKKAELSSEEVRERIDHLLANDYFDLTSKNEELAGLLGFSDYARVWEGVAIAERLLARTWSMATDGYLEQGLLELPRARQQLEHSASVMSSL